MRCDKKSFAQAKVDNLEKFVTKMNFGESVNVVELQASELMRASSDTLWTRMQAGLSGMLLAALCVSVICVAMGVSCASVLSSWVAIIPWTVAVACKAVEAVVLLVAYMAGCTPPGALLVNAFFLHSLALWPFTLQ